MPFEPAPHYVWNRDPGGQYSSAYPPLTLAVTLNRGGGNWAQGPLTALPDKAKFSGPWASLDLWLALTAETGT